VKSPFDHLLAGRPLLGCFRDPGSRGRDFKDL
jgi:hypothetical protein